MIPRQLICAEKPSALVGRSHRLAHEALVFGALKGESRGICLESVARASLDALAHDRGARWSSGCEDRRGVYEVAHLRRMFFRKSKCFLDIHLRASKATLAVGRSSRRKMGLAFQIEHPHFVAGRGCHAEVRRSWWLLNNEASTPQPLPCALREDCLAKKSCNALRTRLRA
jgi:hypothetical protein